MKRSKKRDVSAAPMEILIRFLIGGAVVSAFALLGSMLKPTSFAGLCGAAPSVALATLGLVIAQNGKAYASVECRSMIAGAIAFLVYGRLVTLLLMKFRLRAMLSTLLGTLVWLVAAFSLWIVMRSAA